MKRGKKIQTIELQLKTAHDIDTKMKIVPVDTFDDAVNYLEKLPKKNKR